jgi:hypothetical protein
MKSYVGLAAVMVVVGTASAYSQSLKEKQYFADQGEYLAKEVPFTNQKCETKIEAKLDWSVVLAEADRKGYSPSGYCMPVLGAIRRVCDSAQAGKDAVKQR